ncbi:MAG: SpoIIE family protein phosphatase [Cyclobacteriaceae bacterium]|nr:SpoIIE family protein phosphatase [Cyclobacteriaceae bacterium]
MKESTSKAKEQTPEERVKQLEQEIEMLKLNVEELSVTNQHLVSATWREREMKQKLGEALDELTETKKIVDAQHKSITDSINYAKRIQHAIIPSKNEILTHFKDAFVYFKAKDVVSGDFPWMYRKDKYVYIAAVDCTGHGVPGAMMSLIGNLLLKDIVGKKDIDPAALLYDLHWGVVKTLKQDEEGNKTADGMDVALCRIDFESNEIQYAGAHRPLYHVRNGELEQYKGDKYPIGGNQYEGKNTFTNHSLSYLENDLIYFFSDGFTDQFGGPDQLKFGPKRTRDLLLEHAHLPMSDQHDKVKSAFEEWQGNHTQIDDVLMIGIKF